MYNKKILNKFAAQLKTRLIQLNKIEHSKKALTLHDYFPMFNLIPKIIVFKVILH
jgi:hypothetical protein